MLEPPPACPQVQEILPNYATAIRDRHLIRLSPPLALPLNPVTYTFTSWAQDSDSMLLIPPQEAENQQPLYRITVQLDLNPFLPVSYVTRVFRCGVEDGKLVGKFGLNCNGTPNFIQIGGTTTRQISNVLRVSNGAASISNVLTGSNGASKKYFNWKMKNKFRWKILDDDSPMCICYLCLSSSSYRAPKPVQVATFVPQLPDALPPPPGATLTVFPLGHRLMDEILISLLIVMRMLNQ